MKMRYIIATILIVLAVEVILLVPAFVFTPLGPGIKNYISPPPTPTPQPILTARGTPPAFDAKAAYLLDADTNRTLANVNGEQPLPMASTTKIMTALIALEKANPEQVVTIKQSDIDEAKNNNGSNAQLVVGDKIQMVDLLYALLLPSGDDAAMAIAESISGTQANFVKLMNDYAHKLHLTHTRYINADGLSYKLPDGKTDENSTSAADLAQLTRYALHNERFAQIVQLQKFELLATVDHHQYVWETTNLLLGLYPGTLGIKTGYTVEAGYCLVFAASNAGHHLIGVILNTKTPDERVTDAHMLLDWGFALPLLPPPPTPTPTK
jgi:D-alanyl-D-alanine carboxypeptidase (penicillin-binding protein 5/6)